MRERDTSQAKDFKSAIKRLFSELNAFKTLIIVAFILAILGSILSILAPSQLSNLTDEITDGLTLDKNKVETLAKSIDTSSLNEKIAEIEQRKLSEQEKANKVQAEAYKKQTDELRRQNALLQRQAEAADKQAREAEEIRRRMENERYGDYYKTL